MRKQYNFWPGENGLDAWDVDHLIELSSGLPIQEVPLSEIKEIDSPYWSIGTTDLPTVREIAEHFTLMNEADLDFPIILNVDGRLMDGMHRVAKALSQGLNSIKAIRFNYRPEPDFKDCDPDKLPY
jgi:hypothetical protein